MTKDSLSGCVVVTGGAGALGAAVVRHLARAGRRVAAVDIAGAAAGLAALEKELGEGVLGLTVDVASAASWAEALPRCEAKLGPVDGAALIAGGWRGGPSLHEEADDGTYRMMVERNLDTARGTLRALLPGMVARRRGSIVVVGSRAVERPWTSGGAAAYAASKAAVVAMAQAVAAEVLEHGVRVNAVLPSTIDTAANRAAMPGADPSAWVSADSLAGVLGFLLSDAARDISGAALPVYGRA